MDLGVGTGFVTTALAPLVASVRAVDVSPAMAEALAERAADAGLANVSTEVTDLKDFRLPPPHADLIVSSYALHHLPDADKRAAAASLRRDAACRQLVCCPLRTAVTTAWPPETG